MKRSRHSEEKILFALKQAEAGQAVSDVCRQMGISEATFYVWKKRYANLGTLEMRELRQLREENAKLKRLVADLTLDRHVLQEVVKKRSSRGEAQRTCPLGAADLRHEHPSFVRLGAAASRDVVLRIAGSRQQRRASADAGAGSIATQVRLRAAAHSAEA
jgi:putative transposase